MYCNKRYGCSLTFSHRGRFSLYQNTLITQFEEKYSSSTVIETQTLFTLVVQQPIVTVMSDYNIVTSEQITQGTATDAYFERTEEALNEAGKNPEVVAEITADQFTTGTFEVFAGLQSAAELLSHTNVDVDALPEGQLFDGGPVMRITGNYLDFARYETSLLGFLSQASGIATAALEARTAAPNCQVLSFGARHMHPSVASVIERSALIAGVDGFSHVAAGELLNREASGTMPHALMLAFNGDTPKAAWKSFDKAAPDNVPRIALCDTYTDEVYEVEQTVEALGDRLDGVRLDTTSSRRGDFRHIVKEVRYKLRELDREDVDIFVSGGLGPEEMVELRDVVDGFGIGGYISNADPVDFSLDIVRVNGEDLSKRGKLAGVKNVYRTDDGEHLVVPETRATDGELDRTALLQPLLRDGELVRDEFSIDQAAQRVKYDAEAVGFTTPPERNQ